MTGNNWFRVPWGFYIAFMFKIAKYNRALSMKMSAPTKIFMRNAAYLGLWLKMSVLSLLSA